MKGRKRVPPLASRVVMCTCSVSAAKCTSARCLKQKRGAWGSRSFLYCSKAFRHVWPVPGFLSSQVATGKPLSAKSRSTVWPLVGWQRTWRATVSLFWS